MAETEPPVTSALGDPALWSNEPVRAWTAADAVHVEARAGSDFWHDPRSGDITDNGHFCGVDHVGDIGCEIEVGGTFVSEYDQCGLMIRLGTAQWAKVALDRVDGRPTIATVVTDRFSDSALQPYAGDTCWFRLSRIGHAIAIEARPTENAPYVVIRLARLGAPGPVRIGAMCCAPSAPGFVATFRRLAFGPPPSDLVA